MTTPNRSGTAPSRARSKGKTPARRTVAYPAEVRAAALAQLAGEGMAATHAATGIPKGTLSRWAKVAGLDLGEGARARTAAATEAVRERVAEVKATTVELLEGHLAQAGTFLATVAGVNARAAHLIASGDPDLIEVATGLGGPYAVLKPGEAAELAKVALALDGLPLAIRDAEGIVTRAIHDLQLLAGEATERGELVVEFGGIPRPDPSSVPVVEFPTDEDD